MANYTITHLHTEMSNGVTNIDSITDYKEYIQKAVECGMNAIAFTEHGSILQWLHKKEECEKNGLKYIHASEVYITESLEEKVRDNYHCCLYALNYDGFLELNKLSSQSFNRQDGHFYYMPRITFNELINTSDNIAISTACLAGILSKGNDTIKEQFISFLTTNKHRCFLEIQHHNVEAQIEYNKALYALHKSIGVPLIVGTDTHALNNEHLKGRSILQKAKDIHFDDEDEWDLTFKSYEELVDAYKLQNSLPMDVVYEALENTNRLADMVEEFEIDRQYKYPHLWDKPLELFRDKINAGIITRGVDKYPNYQEYLDRIEYEIEAYIHNGAIDFMLLMEDIISWCKSEGIEVGYGRGSVNGSVIAWLLGITEMDSIKYNLNFDRFMNVERVSLSDIDTDFSPLDIPKVKDYIYNKHGLYCCDIVTFNTIKDKGAIRDVGRALNISLDEVSKICDAVDNEEAYKSVREQYKELFEYVDLVKGTVVSVGSHPCGLVCSPQTVDDNIGLFTTSTTQYPISQLNMKEIDSENYVKLDLLKLDTATVINETCKLAGIDRLTPDNMNVYDETVWNSIRDDSTAIFQWESDTGKDYIKKLMSDTTIEQFKKYNPNMDKLTLFTIGNSAIRPAGASYRNDLANGVVRTTGSKPIDDFLSNTFGYLVFQCQIIDFLHLYCGFTMGEADIVRRCVDENTLITMGDGTLKEIKDIKTNDLVQTFDDNRITTSRVNNVFNNGIKEVYEIKCQNGYSIKATSEHKVLTQDGYKRVSDLIESDYVFTPNKLSLVSDNLRPNQRLSSTDMFLIGVLLGDGCIGGKSYELHFTNSDKELIEKYKECVNNRTRNEEDCVFRINEQNGKTVQKIYSVYIQSKEYRDSVYNLITKLNINCKSADKHIPEELIKYPLGEKLINLMAGLFSTDGGYIENAGCIEYYSISQRLLLNIKNILLKFNIYSYVYECETNGYEYSNYKLRINHKDSLNKFNEIILPYMVGKKKKEFEVVINKTINNSKTYNYLLPKKFVDEMELSLKNNGVSMRSIGIEHLGDYDSITDIKAKKIVDNVYCPESYKLLNGNYEPVKIISKKLIGKTNVYDIEVENTHNYIANGIIVHNCFAKKLGTKDSIPVIVNGGYLNDNKKHYIDGYIKTMKEKYDIAESKSEEDITAFIQVIEDASDYLFSNNHSSPYSLEGYACGWLRTYYPLEFLTVSLNIQKDNMDKTNNLIDYANKVGIKILPIKFRYSGADYTLSKENGAIYKGISSIKNLNAEVSEQLYSLRDNNYNTFIDLLIDIKDKTRLNSRQLDILTKLDFFSEFGSIGKLLAITEYFSLLYGKKQMNKVKAEELGLTELLSKYSGKETEKMYSQIDSLRLLTDMCNTVAEKKITVGDIVKWQQEYLGYIDYKNDKLPKTNIIVTGLNTKYSPRFNAYCLNNGKIMELKVSNASNPKSPVDTFKKKPFENGDILDIVKCTKKPKVKKTADGWETIPNEFNWWLDKYNIISLEG